MSSALSYLSSHGMVHNDIKPANIAYSPQRGAVLFDFGVACSIDESARGGTPWYLPPEFIRNKARGLPGDIWAMGITMLYVLQKINMPEKIAKGWNIWELPPDAAEEGSAKAQMRNWLKFIVEKRTELDQEDRAEGAVFQMLRGKPELRAVAEDIEEALRVTKED
ncbi:hypothetical protein THARTR1_06743 [Trichoderma harzianum]|uniref:Protein kinase domain-containing protein n=1 Tax=Trichoderma harzianum TaxID=5544 RepID=A0A2K0U540_TRIHA|nr:hypothetical protein THARTR1_06743 [Trichoderma harzianum]